MKLTAKIALLLLLAAGISGCGAGVDDTVLPGAREDAIPGQSVFPAPGDEKLSRPASTADGKTDEPAPEEIAAEPLCPDPNDKADPNCAPETSSGDGTFSDGQ